MSSQAKVILFSHNKLFVLFSECVLLERKRKEKPQRDSCSIWFNQKKSTHPAGKHVVLCLRTSSSNPVRQNAFPAWKQKKYKGIQIRSRVYFEQSSQEHYSAPLNLVRKRLFCSLAISSLTTPPWRFFRFSSVLPIFSFKPVICLLTASFTLSFRLH